MEKSSAPCLSCRAVKRLPNSDSSWSNPRHVVWVWALASSKSVFASLDGVAITNLCSGPTASLWKRDTSTRKQGSNLSPRKHITVLAMTSLERHGNCSCEKGRASSILLNLPTPCVSLSPAAPPLLHTSNIFLLTHGMCGIL